MTARRLQNDAPPPLTPLTVRRVFTVWWPLAGSWLLMTVESLTDFDTFTAMMNEMREEGAG